MEKKWVLKDFSPDEEVSSLAKELTISHQLSTLLYQRGIKTFDAAKQFFRPSLDRLHDPFLMKDMDKAVNRISEAISANEKILVYGDYDVDGTTSVSLVYSFLKELTDSVKYYIPDRYLEGYGLSKKGVEWAAAQDFTLIITLDCGIKAIENTALANELKIDLIICDHHEPGSKLPEAYAVLDPKRNDCQYPYKELSGCGVGFKLLQGFCIQNTIQINQLYQYLDLVAVSIASDIVPITGENRILAFYGLRKLNKEPLPGIKSLIEISGIKTELTISDVVFYIGPRINAAGRINHANDSVRLLISDDEDELLSYSGLLNQANIDRKEFDQDITSEALEMIAQNEKLVNAKSTVLFKKDWHKGVIGIVASRCTEHYYRPTIILTESLGKATGSARSVEDFDVYEAISETSDLLLAYGGHKYAAGLSMELDKVDVFREKFEEVVAKRILPDQLIPKLSIDLNVDFDFIDFKSLSIMNQMGPFGPKNLQPVFSTENVQLNEEPRLLKDKHLRLTVNQKEFKGSFAAIGFGLSHLYEELKKAKTFRIAYHIEENNYLGNKTIQLILKDIKFYH